MNNNYPASLQKQYTAMNSMRQMMETMKLNQELRGGPALEQRLHARATKPNPTWRQLSGMKLFLSEIKQPGVQPFFYGLWYVRGKPMPH
jgi:hypothetical protein